MERPVTQEQRADFLIRWLLNERKEYKDIAIPVNLTEKRQLLRSLMNVRPPVPADNEFLTVQDAYLQERLAERGVTRIGDLSPVRPGIYLWQGDITTLAIHTYAGVQLRQECASIMAGQKAEPTGRAKITKAYNLPCRYVLHTVGPIIYGGVTETDRKQLADCYRSCLNLAAAYGLRSVAFCCISTGEFHFPNRLAAEIAIMTVEEWQKENPDQMEVIFNVFKDNDYKIYRQLLR